MLISSECEARISETEANLMKARLRFKGRFPLLAVLFANQSTLLFSVRFISGEGRKHFGRRTKRPKWKAVLRIMKILEERNEKY